MAYIATDMRIHAREDICMDVELACCLMHPAKAEAILERPDLADATLVNLGIIAG